MESEDVSSLKQVIGDLMKSRGDMNQLAEPKTMETPLHRALSKGTVNMVMISLLVRALGDDQICTCQRVCLTLFYELCSFMKKKFNHLICFIELQ